MLCHGKRSFHPQMVIHHRIDRVYSEAVGFPSSFRSIAHGMLWRSKKHLWKFLNMAGLGLGVTLARGNPRGPAIFQREFSHGVAAVRV